MNIEGLVVETCVFVNGQRVPMRKGIVTRDDDSGTCEVDIGSLYGCAPWKVLESKAHLRVLDESDLPEAIGFALKRIFARDIENAAKGGASRVDSHPAPDSRASELHDTENDGP